jgi:glycogen(starch) synthase
MADGRPADARGLRRILMTADAVGGVWEYALELTAGLADAGVEVTMAVMGPAPDDAQRSAARRLPNLELCVEPFKLEWMHEPWSDVAAAGRWLLRLAAARGGVDLVHLNGFAHGALPFGRPKVVVGHSCVLSWWRAVEGTRAPESWDRYRAAVSAGLAGADRVVAPTAWMLAALGEHCRDGKLRRGEVIYNGRSAETYRPGRKRPVILSAGRLWDRAKNAELVARAARALAWQVRIAGSRAMDRARRDGAAGVPPEGGTYPNVAFLGRLPAQALAAEYAAASVYALPARYEPFGLTVLEAALSGCALVLGDIPSLRELWDGAAQFVDPGDEAGLVAACRSSIANGAVCARRGAAARARGQRYSATETVRRYLALYRGLLDGATSALPPGHLAAGEIGAPCAS